MQYFSAAKSVRLCAARNSPPPDSDLTDLCGSLAIHFFPLYLASSGRVRLGLFTYDGRLLSRKGHGTIRIVETTRSDTRLLEALPLGNGQKRRSASCCPAKQQDIPDVKPLQSTHRSLLHAPTPFHTTYDGEGRRVKKIVGTEVTIFVYDASGQLSAEYSTTVVPQAQAKVSYLTTDHLGSPRVITDQNGAVTSRKDFTAFGEAVTSSQRVGGTNGNGYDPPNLRQDYTGYQKDSESGLEFAQARYYNTGHGRFTSVDPLTASSTIKDPQTFNRYSYVLNSPYEFTDPLGLAHCNTGRCVRVGGGDWFTSSYEGTTPQFTPERAQTSTINVSGLLRNLAEQSSAELKKRLPLIFADGIPPPRPSPSVDRDSSDSGWSAQNSALSRAFTDGSSFARANRSGEGPQSFLNGAPTHYRLSTGEIMGIHVYGDVFGLAAPNIFIPDGFDTLTNIRPTWLGILNSKNKEFIVAFHIKGVKSKAQFQANRRFHNAAGFRFIGPGGGPGGNNPGYIHSCIKIFKDRASGLEYIRQINLATFDFDARRYGDLRKYLP